MIKKEPRMEYSDLLGFLLIYLGLLFFVVLLHIITINTKGFTNNVMNQVFKVYFISFIGSIIMGFVYSIIHLLRWMVWYVGTPDWQRKKQRNNGL